MRFRLLYTDEAASNLAHLGSSPALARKLKVVQKTLGLMETNLRHPSLNTHKFESLQGMKGEPVFESYAENNTPGACRVFWHYTTDKRGFITVVAITAHP
ncbi:MAG: hypothetical protein HY748_07145 [Elusimicrobia bacterium]|nr:hypothetical protein [Elusimicrobiota bacterium]